MNKWEERYDRLIDWFYTKQPSVQALLVFIFTVVGLSLVGILIYTIGFIMFNVLGWWNIVIIPSVWYYLYLYSEFYDERKREERNK